MTFKIWDVAGQPKFRSMWERYCNGVDAVVYVLVALFCVSSVLFSLCNPTIQSLLVRCHGKASSSLVKICRRFRRRVYPAVTENPSNDSLTLKICSKSHSTPFALSSINCSHSPVSWASHYSSYVSFSALVLLASHMCYA